MKREPGAHHLMMTGTLLRGLAAGAAGTTLLNAYTYLDMAVRGRPASSTPDQLVAAVADRAGWEIPGAGSERDNRRTALGALAGIGNGVVTGVLASVARSAGVRFSPVVGAAAAGAVAMAAQDVPVALLGIDDPRSWSREDWITDIGAHLTYGAGVQAVLQAIPTPRERATPRNAARAGLVLRSALLGVANGARSSVAFAATALTDPRAGGVAKKLGAVGLLTAELTADKRPETPVRTGPAGLPPRFLGAVGGAVSLARREQANAAVPVLAGAAGAAAGAWGGLAWRRWGSERLSYTNAALIEDGVALVLAALATLPGRTRRPKVAVSR